MKNQPVCLLGILASAVWLTAAEPAYYLSFDKTLQADFGGTGTASVTTVDSEQGAVGMMGVLTRKSGKVTADKLLVPGLKSNAFISGKDAYGNIHTAVYKPVPAMNGKECTVSFWLKSENWMGDDKNQHVFVSASGPGSQRLLIYRIPYQSRLAVYLGPLNNSKAATVIFTRVPSWKPGQWHQVTVSWNERALQLHLDGVSQAMSPLKTPLDSDFHTIAIGEHFGSSDPGQTLIDELRIFDKKLSEKDLQQEFLRLAPELPAAAVPAEINVGKRTVKIDGTFASGEYPFSTVGMRELRSRSLCIEDMRAAFSYDDENLYVGFLSPGKSLKTSATGHDSKVWLDDSVELLIDTGKDKSELHQLIFNSAGVCYDGLNDNASWNAPGVRTASKIDNNVWIFEAAIPWKSLGITVPDNCQLKINVCRNTPVSRNTLAGVRSQYAEVEHFIPVTFSADTPDFHLNSLGTPGDGKLDMRFEALSQTGGKLKVRAEAPAPLYAFERETFVELPAASGRKGVITGERLPEKPLLKISAELNGKVFYRNTIPCGTSQPVLLSHIYTDIKQKQLVSVFKNQRLDAGECQVNVIFFDRAKTRKIYEKSVKINDSVPLVEVRMSIASLVPGDYHIEQQIFDPDGKYLFSENDIYMIPQGEGMWAGTSAGISDEVPPPWTPVKDVNGTFYCWGRNYKFGGEALISSIISQNRELLNRPVALKFNGKALEFDIVNTVAKPDSVTYTLLARDKSVEVTAFAEYDGVVWFTVKLPDGAVKPASLVLELPLDRKYADGFDDNNNCFEKISFIGKSDFQFYIDPVANPFFWCGGNDIGICGGTHTHRGRYVKDKRRAMTVTGNDKEVLVSLNLVDSPIKDRKERQISFYLQPTPTKPLNPKPWNIRDRINNMVVFNVPRYFNTMRPGQLDDLKKWSYHYRMIIKPYTAKDVTFQYYFAPKGAGAYSAEWNYFGDLWHNSSPVLGNYAGKSSDFSKKPKAWTYGCLNSRNYLDFQIDSMKYYLDNPHVDVRDLYFDLSWPRSCGNKLHGCVWVDEFGYEHHDNDLLPLREFYRRVWHMVRRKNPDTFIIGHLISTRTPADSYFDVIAAGEMYEDRLLNKGKISYFNVLDPELMRIAYGTRTNEASVALIGQFSQAVGRFLPDKLKTFSFDEPAVDLAVRHFLAYELVCGLSPYYYCGKTRPGEIYAAFDQLGSTRPEFHPWWAENPAVKADNGALAALYTNNGNALAAVLNDSDKPVTVTLTFDGKFNLNNLKCNAIFSRKNYQLQGDKMTVSLAPREGELFLFKR